ncbi:MAG: slipin family protein, partial [Nanoarchaeota archaeon]|nr:slipin family protein [Nanoarchaeota archaeon]
MAISPIITGIIVLLILVLTIKQVNQFERGVKFRFGKYIGLMQPGWRIVIPIIESWVRVDLRIRTFDVTTQECVSKDNISIRVNAVLYFKVKDASKAILEVEEFEFAVSQLSQTTMRNIVGEFELDEILQQREKISKKIQSIVDDATDVWGIKVTRIELKDIELPEDMKRVIARAAEAVRERRANILKAEGEVIAADDLASAAKTLSKSDGA